MTREELKEHCKRLTENCEMWATLKGEKPHGKIYEEHKLILELLEQETVSKEVYEHEYFLRKELDFKLAKLEQDKNVVLDKIRAEIEKLQKMCDKNDLNLMAQYSAFGMVLDILDKYKADSESQESEE